MKNKIKMERAMRDMTQAALADMIGVSRQTVNTIESGRYVPSTALALKISRVFDKSVNELFELEDSD